MLATFGQLTEFRVAFGGSRGTVTLIYGDKRRKRTRGNKPCAPGAAKGEPKAAAKLPAAVPSFVPPPDQPGASREVQGGPKLMAKPPVAVPSGNRSPASPTRTTRTGPRQMYPTHTSTPWSSKSGTTLPPTATMEVPVEQVAQKRKASSPLPPKTVTRPVSPPSPTRWEKARSRIRGRFRDYISTPVENIADLPRKPASETWQVLPEEMGKVNIGLTGRNNAILVIYTCQGELFQQVVIDKTADNATGHALLMSLLGDGYRILLPCVVRLHDKYPWLQISDSSQWVPGFHLTSRASQTLILFGKAFKMYYYYFFLINTLTLILLTARQNCSQITSNLDLSKQIFFFFFFNSPLMLLNCIQNFNST